MKDILLVSDNQELIQNLETIVTFMGESCLSRGLSDCHEYLSKSGADAVLIEYACETTVSQLVENFPHIPFVALVQNEGEIKTDSKIGGRKIKRQKEKRKSHLAQYRRNQ